MWHKLYGAWNVACMEYKKLIRSTKMIILAMFLIFVNIQIITPLKQCAIGCKVIIFRAIYCGWKFWNGFIDLAVILFNYDGRLSARR